MQSNEIREKFFDFFSERNHIVVPSSSLLPDDPSVLFTTAGMQQFKPYFIGKADPLKDFNSKRTSSIQKCFRTSDIDEVGDGSHLTFFEMMGNFSFGDYFKKEAIWFAYDFLVKEMGIPKNRLYATIFKGGDGIPRDGESEEIWIELGFGKDRIFEFGRKENFWGPTGTEGPCGPTSEIHYKIGDSPCGRKEKCVPNCPCGRFIEIWNLVFNEFYCSTENKLSPLLLKGIDTGMGFERLALAVNNKRDIYETDLFLPVISHLKDLMDISAPRPSSSFNKLYAPPLAVGEDLDRVVKDMSNIKFLRSWRIIADHIRGSVFLISDGVLPSNIEQGYILRRLLRKSIRHGKLLNLPDGWLKSTVELIIDKYGQAYSEIKNKRKHILEIVSQENNKFSKALEKGLKEFAKISNQKISGKEAFRLYESYGFPLELTEELAKEKGIRVDKQEFEEEFKRHQEVSRAGLEGKFGGHGLVMDTGELKARDENEIKKVTRMHTATHILQQALKDVLGDHVKQMGSDINNERLRFDFSHEGKLTEEELRKVEEIVNSKISDDLKVKKEEMSFQEAIDSGAKAFFKEKYPERVTVYSIGDYSRELCGGPHVPRTGEIGKFKIIKQESVGAGVRRIRARVE